MKLHKPLILAPAGNKASFLAAVAAGADAVYCGLKQYSARMAAKNFTLNELASLTDLAHRKGVKVFVAFNTAIWGPASATSNFSGLAHTSHTAQMSATRSFHLTTGQLHQMPR